MADLSDEDLKFVLSVDPDMDALNKALNQINAEIESAKVSKIRMGLEAPIDLTAKDLAKPEKKDDTHEQLLAGILGGQGGGTTGQLAGMAGEAIGGPVGAVVGEQLAKMVPTIAGGMNTMTMALQGMQGPLGPIGAGLDVMSAGLIKIAPLLGPFGEALAALPGFIKDSTVALTSMAEKAAPGVVKQFNMALEDAQATMGQAFIPVVEMMTEGVRVFSDVLANLIPNTGEVSGALGILRSALDDLGAEFMEFAKEFGPLIREFLIINIKALGAALTGIATAARAASLALRTLLGPLVDMLGLGGGGTRGATSAARTPHLGGIEEYQRQLQLETFGKGSGTADMPTNVSNIFTKVSEMADSLKDLIDGFKSGLFSVVSIPKKVESAMDGVLAGAAGAMFAYKSGR